MELDDLARAEELLAAIDAMRPGEVTPSLAAHRARFHARLDARRGNHDHVGGYYRTAETVFGQHGLVFHHAVTQLEHAEWLSSQDRADEAFPLIEEARESFERLEAKSWLQRLDAVQSSSPAKIPA